MRKIVIPLTALLPHMAFAFTPPQPTAPIPSTSISQIGDFYQIILAVARWALVFGLVIGVVFVIWGGVKYVTAGGDESKAEEGKKIIIGALIGVVFLVLAVALINIIANFFGSTGPAVSL